MKRIVLSILVALTAFLATTPGAVAQGERIEILEVDSSAYPHVEMLVSVPPGVSDGEVLQEGAFGLTEAGTVRDLRVTAVQDQIDIVLLVDTSGSMRGAPMDAAIDAATAFLSEVPPSARVAVVGFASEPYVVSELSTDRAEAAAALSSLTARGETGLWDGLIAASSVLLGSESAKYVVLLSDGADTVSAHTQAQAVETLRTVGTPLYSIALETPESDFSPLQTATAEVGGGQYLAATDVSALGGLYQELAERLSSRYVLAFEAIGSGPEEVVVSVASDGAVSTAQEELTFAPLAPGDEGSDAEEVYESVLRDGVGSGPGGWLAEPAVLWLGAVAFFLSLVILGGLVARPALKVRLAASAATRSTALSGMSDRLSGLADEALEGSERGRRLDGVLDAAGIEIRPGELLVAVMATSVAGGILGGLVAGPLMALALIIAAPTVTALVIKRRLRKRRAAFGEQIADTLMILSGALRAGRGLSQALDLVAEEAPSPTREEFRRVIIESRIGRDLITSLEEVADRMQSEDFRWLSEAVGVNRDLGGNLSEVLDNIGGVVRARDQIARQVQALSAEGRMSGWVLLALPLLLFAYLQVASPDYGGELLKGFGLVLMAVSGALLAVGWLWIRKLVDFEY